MEAAQRVRVLQGRVVAVDARALPVHADGLRAPVAGVQVGVGQQLAVRPTRAVDRVAVQRVAHQPRGAVGGLAPRQAGGDRVVVVHALLLGMPAAGVLDLVGHGVAVAGVQPVEDGHAVRGDADRPAAQAPGLGSACAGEAGSV